MRRSGINEDASHVGDQEAQGRTAIVYVRSAHQADESPVPAGNPRRARRAWTEGDDRVLCELWAENVPASGIAKWLGRTPGAVTSRANNMRLGLRTTLWGGRRSIRCAEGERAERRCLNCGEQFASAHKGNRICGTCKVDEDWGSGPDYTQRRIRRRRYEEIDE